MEKNRILGSQDNTKIVRILEVKESSFLVIDCIKRTMPQWKDKEQFKDWKSLTEQELWEITDIYPSKTDTALSTTSKYIQEHYSLIAGILPFIGDEKERSRMIRSIAELKNYSKQTIRNTLCLYLVYQDISVLAPKEKKEKELSRDEKIMRWSLNKFFYTKNQNTLTTAYTMMLKEKYTDAEGTLLPHPSIHQFRYFYKKTKKQQNFYISREGVKKYQRNRRPLLGQGVQEFASSIGMAMLDSTICDIYLVNERGELIGRPVLTACIDAYSSICCGYSLGWEGGIYSLRGLMLNVITDKVEHCRKYGIDITEKDWKCKELPGTLVTDKGAEYASENFEQLTDLGVSIINLPAYRPELKGSVEKFFDVIQSIYKPYLKGKGVIEPDFQERGSHDYRKDACLTLEQFEKILLYCIIYYNTSRTLENFPFTKEMLEKKINPYASEIWNYGKKEVGANLLTVSKEELIMCLMPRTTGRFSRFGLRVNKLRYRHDNYTEKYLTGGEVTVAYNPDDVSNVWMIEKSGRYVKFELIESRFDGVNLETVQEIQTKTRERIQTGSEASLQAQVQLARNIENVVNMAMPQKSLRLKDIRNNRKKEQNRIHKDYVKECEE